LDISPKVFDHTALKPETTTEDIEKLCREAREFGFFSVCVNSAYVALAKKLLEGSDVKVCAVVGFPLGAMSTDAKVFETRIAIMDGASEIDMVANNGSLKSGNYEAYYEDIAEVAHVCHRHGVTLKVILETCLLSNDDKHKACQLALEAGADFLKTSTGFSTGGATKQDVAFLSSYAHSTPLSADSSAMVGKTTAQAKASGGIRTGETAIAMLEAGADRLGTSATVAVYKEAKDILAARRHSGGCNAISTTTTSGNSSSGSDVAATDCKCGGSASGCAPSCCNQNPSTEASTSSSTANSTTTTCGKSTSNAAGKSSCGTCSSRSTGATSATAGDVGNGQY
jgi:deoxyribose-phosphate aldolase